ncbi:hypothetical protein ACFQ4Z_02895 [Oceanobacillus oncorhynchi subsp. oncorhynchi]|uniref:hypothetical protein n=1 Tax=Oceanobacillus TaxID=182709 RepID=UPI0030D792C6
MSYQGKLEQAMDELNEEELKRTLIEICLIANRGNDEEKQDITKDILDTINTNILKES